MISNLWTNLDHNQQVSGNVYCHGVWYLSLTCSSYFSLPAFLSANVLVLGQCSDRFHNPWWVNLWLLLIAKSWQTLQSTVLFTPRCSLCGWMLTTWLSVNFLLTVVHHSCIGLAPSLSRSNYHCGMLVSWSARFRVNLTSVTSIKTYLSTSPQLVSKHCLTKISLAALGFMHAFMVRVPDIQWWTHAESVTRYETVTCIERPNWCLL